MNDCYSTIPYGTTTGLRVETTASSFFALPYHQLERVDFNSAGGADTVIVSFITCKIRITGKRLHRMASQIARHEVDSICVLPKNSPPPDPRSTWIDKIEATEKEIVP